MNQQVAVFLESPIGDNHYQSVLLGVNGEVEIFNRFTDGTSNRGNAWYKADQDHEYPTTPLLRNPVAIVLTDNDIELAQDNHVGSIFAKAVSASENAEVITSLITHREAIADLAVKLQNGDQSITALITDKRRTNGVVIAPLEKKSDMPIEPNVLNVPTKEIQEEVQEVNEMAMNLISVPDKKWADQYINRKFDGVSDFEIYDYARANAINVLLEGSAGAGKTISVQAYASARGLRYFNVANNNGIEPSQLFGRWIPDSNGHYRWQDGAVSLLFRHGGVLLLNEINFLPVRVSTVLFSALDYRREIQILENGGEVIKAHPDLLIIGDMNAGYRGTQELNQAFSDRFGIKLEVPYDRVIENKVVGNKALLTLADQLREQYDKEELSTPISTRSLVAFMDNAKAFGVDFAITSFINAFNKDERSGVRLALETHKHNIADELGVKVSDHESELFEVLA
jgi:MoxR-like ATPase